MLQNNEEIVFFNRSPELEIKEVCSHRILDYNCTIVYKCIYSLLKFSHEKQEYERK